MNDELIAASQDALVYPSEAPLRRHGPLGYTDYRSYKPWLRDEFAFRCVYCLIRERWRPDGQDGFSVEHVLPQATHSGHIGDYENLIYVCNACNAYRQDCALPVDPRTEGLGNHLRVIGDGRIKPLTTEGKDLIDICQLDRRSLVVFRRRLLRILDLLTTKDDDAAQVLLVDYLGFPDDLPDLLSRRPPGGNRRPDGIAQSHFVLKRDHTLSLVY